MLELSIVIPVYNAESCLEELYRRLVHSLESISKNFEIILVEDCGGDRSWEFICELSKRDPRIKGLKFSRNFGQHYAITAGLDRCEGDWIVVMDCDLQDRPEEIPRLYAKAKEGYDVVLAKRGKRSDPLLKRISSRMFYRLFNYMADLKYDPEVGNFRIISRRVANAFLTMREQLRFFGGMVDWLGFPSASINVEHAERFAGETSYDFRKLSKLATETIVAYSDKPLRLTIRFGFTMAGVAFAMALYYVYRGLVYDSPVLGWSSLIVSIYLLGGIIIAVLGIIGLYLGKTFDQTKNRPLYVVMETAEQ
ncbi:MAG: glycosyltransferase family 2 protein [Desulfuromonadales bacterium]|nr:glycosyltransferase family 2 protein [Desulfuromonadales bacterium]